MEKQHTKVLAFDYEKFHDYTKVVPNAAGLFAVSKLNMKLNHDLTDEKIEKRLVQVNFFYGVKSCVTFMFDYVLEKWEVGEKQIFEG